MVLQKQLIQLPFGGLQTKADPKIAPIGTYSSIDNFIMRQYPELVKRDGLSSIGVSTVPPNITTNYNYLNEVGVITTEGLYSYSASLDQFQSKGKTAAPIISADPVIANTFTQINCDSYVSENNILGSIWEDSRGGVRMSAKDTVSDTLLQSDYSISTTGVKPKVIAQRNQLMFFWIEPSTTTLMVQQYNTLTNIFYTAIPVTTTVAACYTYDIIINLDAVLIAVVQTNAAPDAIWAYYYNPRTHDLATYPDGLPAPLSFDFANSGSLPPSISLATNTDQTYIVLTVYNDSNEVWTRTYFLYLGAPNTETQINVATADAGWALASCLDSNKNLYVFFSSKGSKHNSFRAKVSNVDTTQVIDYSEEFILQMGVVSKAFYFNNNAYVVIGYDSPLQATYFGVRDDGACFGRFFTQISGGNIQKANCLSSFSPLYSKVDTYIVALLKTTKIVSSANTFNSTTSVFTEQMFFSPATIDNKVLGRFLNIAGGYLKQYDGSETVYEQGFHLYPEQPTLVASMGAGSIANGSYAYAVVWEWVDNQGQIHRSEPSIGQNIVVAGADNTVTVTVPTLPITNKETRFTNTRTPIVMAVYRTLNLGTQYYRVNQLTTQYVYNDTTAQTISFTDTYADSSISSNSLLYTTGGVLQNIAPPAANLLAVGKNRIILAGIDTEPNQVFYSKEKEEGIGVEFSNELSFIVDSLGGKITALAAMDDKILIFKQSLVYYVAGTLPDKLGNGTAPFPLLVAADCGCSNPQSIVLTGMGIMFQSPKGIYLIDRQLNVSYIGQEVDRFVNQEEGGVLITGAVNLPDQNLVYFTNATNNQVLVYDTYFKQWYTQSLQFSPLSLTLLGSSVYISSSDKVVQSNPNQPNDDFDSIKSSIKTNWISVAQMEGFARIYAIMILGDNANLSHTLNVNLYYDFEDHPRESLKITPTSLFSSTWGSDATWGDSTLWGGASSDGSLFTGAYQFVVRPKQQKCSSIRIEIFDSFPDGNRSDSFKFSGISLVAGIKQGWNKGIPYTQRLT